MHEIFPIAAGIATALLVCTLTLTALWLRVILLVASAVFFGIVSSFISGELTVSWAYPVFDTVQVLIAAVSSMAIIVTWKRRLAREG